MSIPTYMTNAALVRANFQCECEQEDHGHIGRCECRVSLDAFCKDDPFNQIIDEDAECVILCKPSFMAIVTKQDPTGGESNSS